jgi:hypothetical protein
MIQNTRFARQYKTFDDWLKTQSTDTLYIRRIIRLHDKYPGATLSQLRGHPRENDLPLYTLKLRECKPGVLQDFVRIANDFALVSKLFDYDEKGRVRRWRRPKDEPA